MVKMTQLNTIEAFLVFTVIVLSDINNYKTLVFFFVNVVLIKGCVSVPNVVFIHFSIWSLKDLLLCKFGLIMYPISEELIHSPLYSIQIKRLAICNNGRR